MMSDTTLEEDWRLVARIAVSAEGMSALDRLSWRALTLTPNPSPTRREEQAPSLLDLWERGQG